MNPAARAEKWLRAPIRKLAGCVSGLKGRRWSKRSRAGGGGGRRWGRHRAGRAPPRRNNQPMVVRSYQADLEKERKLREAMNAQKNAQRAAMRAHFRRKYQLSENPKDTSRLRSVPGKLSLPHELTKIIHPEAKAKDASFSLLRAFQGLSVGTATPGKRHGGRTPAPTGRGDACKVM